MITFFARSREGCGGVDTFWIEASSGFWIGNEARFSFFYSIQSVRKEGFNGIGISEALDASAV